ncbi:uncharacterized protein LOC124379535 [Silurus meridionalis]|uniref:Ig-like domain-containing protein n=1 Tax=Silurus meridionalis TaxID=175797 RepID=A0A8T0ABS4_SILME|nr:uncharacterized protein LOC124379535 [Silurus meridionalis]KAF7688607.1 hypothetical protein HF521_013414 [Silurus meridionalis]
MELRFIMMRLSVWMPWCCLMYVQGEILCNSELLIHSNITAELQSDVLLPCNLHPTLLGSDKTADIAVVWTQRNTTTHSLLEISLQGDVRFWDHKGGRIKTFPKLSESGNFSILLQKVQLYDLSLYRCELFNGFNCSLAYQEIQLDLAAGLHQAIIIIGASTGAVLLFLFTACVFYLRKKPKQKKMDVAGKQPHPESTGGSVECPFDNPIYDIYRVQPGPETDEALVGENPIYEN